jgi:pseudo-rSAM protein
LNKNPINKKPHWFYIDTFVHITIKKECLLLYNTLNGKSLEYNSDTSQGRKIINLVKRLTSSDNLQVLQLSVRELNDHVIATFIEKLKEYFMGDLIDTATSKGKPVQMMPIVTVQRDVEKMKKEPHRSVGEEMMQYLTELSLYITNRCSQTCEFCCNAYKQIPCCTKLKSHRDQLDVQDIQALLKECKSSSLVKLNILGGDIFLYDRFEELLSLVNQYPAQKVFFSHYENIIPAAAKLKLMDTENSIIKIIIPYSVDMSRLKSTFEIIEKFNLNTEYLFIVRDVNDFVLVEEAGTRFGIEELDLRPYFNGLNLNFFRDYIFMDKEELFETKLSLQYIYQNTLVNSLNFGRLIVLSNGSMHTNVNKSRLGILGRDSVYDVLHHEMDKGKSWRRVRKHVAPCKGCCYQYLCPPLSDYTFAIGRNNLCNIFK